VEGWAGKVETDLAAVKYLATLLGAKEDDVPRHFILTSRRCWILARGVTCGSDADTARGQWTTPEAQDGCARGPQSAPSPFGWGENSGGENTGRAPNGSGAMNRSRRHSFPFR
jgi:hypothetical protein